MFDEFRSCYNKLQFFDNIIEQITQKIGTRNRLDGIEKQDVQGLLKELKGELKKDYDFMSKVDVRNTLSDIDKYFYYPTIQKTLSCISAKINSMPNQKWVNQLREAQIEIRHCMEEIENYL
jgi:hypothetical protein